MIFSSFTFLLFLAVVLALYHSPLWRKLGTAARAWTARKTLLLGASYLFYMAWNPIYVFLLLFSTLVDWFVVRGLAVASTRTQRRLLLATTLLANLGLLSAYKYADFFAKIFVDFAALVGFRFEPIEFGLVLPVGISFYTFQTLSYTLDIYRGEKIDKHSFLDFALFVTFFPQLVAGPIVRAIDFLAQTEKAPSVTAEAFRWGWFLLVFGLFQKVVLADYVLAPVVAMTYESDGIPSALDVFVSGLSFYCQVYFDFSGYSNCAIGCSLMLGFQLRTNFFWPMGAQGFSDNWRRWHISLGSWFRDYVYFALGGSKKGNMRSYVNIMVMFGVTGLWHGAAYSWVLWGLLHGACLVSERAFTRATGKSLDSFTGLLGLLVTLATFFTVAFLAIIFRAHDLHHAWELMSQLFCGQWSLVQTVDADEAFPFDACLASIVVATTLVASIRFRHRGLASVVEGAGPVWVAIGTGIMIFLCFCLIREAVPFVYFAF